MRIAASLALLALAACSNEAPGPERRAADLEPGLFADADGKSGLCIDTDGDAAFVLYGEGKANCMAEGVLEADAKTGGVVFLPRGDTHCRFPLAQDGDTLTFSEGEGTCAYYCGGDATVAGRAVNRSTSMVPLADGAGERLC